MTPGDRIGSYSQIAAGAAVALWAVLCFLMVVSPRGRRLEALHRDLDSSRKQLAEMRKEIEDARIAGGPAVGGARFEKFGILSTDEEQLFLSDLIAFCKGTSSTLNLVRRSEFSEAAQSSEEPPQRPRPGQPKTATSADQAAQPVILRVPHTVSFSGTFLSSFHLLRKLEAYKRLLTVERMELRTDPEQGYPAVNGHITIELYLVKQPAVGAPPGGVVAAGPNRTES